MMAFLTTVERVLNLFWKLLSHHFVRTCVAQAVTTACVEQRRYVQDLLNASGAGPETPIRLVVFDWASARVATALAAIFIRN